MAERLMISNSIRAENLCLEKGCFSACCHDVTFYMLERPDKFFDDPVQMESILDRPNKEGVYYAISGGQYKIIIVGPCPNLENFQCDIYPDHPPGCQKTKINSRQCEEARKR